MTLNDASTRLPPVMGDSVRYRRVQLTVTIVQGHGVGECAVEMSQPT